MSPIKLLSTDFDGTLFAEFENPPIPKSLLDLIAQLQARGVIWAINTGREMASLMEILGRARIPVKPDFLVLVEREIHEHRNSQYIGLADWNDECQRSHEQLFIRVRQDLPRLRSWVDSQFSATVYEDAWSPFCLIAENNKDADAIHAYMEAYCAEVPNLQVVRNDVYARFAHSRYNKGTALEELSRRLGIFAANVFAVGDHLNDLPMLDLRYAQFLAAPANAIDAVKETVATRNGFVSSFSHGAGVDDSLRYFLGRDS